jgi:hypothetical protein
MNGALLGLKPKPDFAETVANPPADDLQRRRELGQFFTPPEVAAFVWDLIEVIHGGPFPLGTLLIDPACGEGVFLRVAHERSHLPARNLFGADIDLSLERGWRDDSLLRHANMKIADGLLDDPEKGVKEGAFDVVAGNPPFSGNGLQHLLDLLDQPAEAGSHKEQDLFGASQTRQDLAPRARLPVGQRGELDRLVRSLCQYYCWRLETEPEPSDETAEPSESKPAELFAADVLLDRCRATASDYERTAQFIARWPANRPLDASRTEIRDVIRRLARTPIEVMFTERFVRLAKPRGLIALIVPESIVASDRLGPFRIWLLGRMDLLASISLPQKVFTGVGANARTSIVFARRRPLDQPDGWYSPEKMARLSAEDEPVFLAAPRVDAPGFSLEAYLSRVLTDARRERHKFWPATK